MMEGDDVPSMESLVQELASSRLDTSSPSKRKQVVQKAAKRVTENADDRSVLASFKGEPSILLRKIRTAFYVEDYFSQVTISQILLQTRYPAAQIMAFVAWSFCIVLPLRMRKRKM
jgi:hypothetical protein